MRTEFAETGDGKYWLQQKSASIRMPVIEEDFNRK